MKAFHNDQKIKDKYLDRVRHHKKMDRLIKGIGWEKFGSTWKGCAVGCTLEDYDHSRYPIELGIPEWLAHVEDSIFESLPTYQAMKWPEKFLSAIPVGADLQTVKAPFLIFVLERTLNTFNHERFPDVKKSIDRVIDLYRSGETDIKTFKDADADAAHASAYAAADAAAYASAYAADAAHASAYVAVAASAAHASAYVAAAAHAASYYADAVSYVTDDRNSLYVSFSEKLLELLKEAK